MDRDQAGVCHDDGQALYCNFATPDKCLFGSDKGVAVVIVC